MPIETFAGKGISSTYQRVVQTDGTYLADGTGSLINNITIPGNLVVSGTLYAQNTVVVTQSFSSGSNILGDAADDFQTLYGTVRIPTGSLTVSGALQISSSQTSYIVGSGNVGIGTTAPDARLTVTSVSGDLATFYNGSIKRTTIQSTGDISYNTNYSLGLVWGAASLKFAGQPEGVQVIPYSANYVGFSIKGFSGQTFDLQQWKNSSGVAMSVVNNNGSFGIGTTSPSASLHISGSSSQTLLRIDSPATSSIIYISGSGVIGFNQTSSLNAQATFRGVQGSVNTTEINTTSNGYYGLRTDGPVKAVNYFFANAGGGSIQTYTGVDIMTFDSSRNVGISVSSSIGARLHVRGSGTTSATTAFRVDNANASASLVVLDDRQTRITSDGAALYVAGAGVAPYSQNIAEFWYSGNGNSIIIAQRNGVAGLTTSPNANLHFDPSGSAAASVFLTGKQVRFNNLFNNGALALQNNGATGESRLDFITGSTTVMSVSGSGNIGIGITNPTYKLDVSGSGRFTAGLSITGSAGTGSAVTIYKSGSTALDIQGSSGQLFAVTDSLTGSLFSVNTAAGLPTIEAFSDNTVNIGKFGSYPIKVVSLGTAAAVTGSFSGSVRATSITLTGSLNVSGSQNYVGDVNINGTLTATVKSFLIEHPTQPGKKLQYGNLEGPEHAVYFRGRSTSSIIELPEEWTGLVDEESITVQLTSIGKFQPLYVSNITSTRVEIQVSEPISLNYHYLIHGERKDIDKLITTIS